MNLDEKLGLCYEIIMTTVRDGLFNARGARGGYTHWFGPELSKEIRTFSGIVTKEENTILRRKEFSGDYSKAGIQLVHWREIPSESKVILRKKLVGKILNIDEFSAK